MRPIRNGRHTIHSSSQLGGGGGGGGQGPSNFYVGGAIAPPAPPPLIKHPTHSHHTYSVMNRAKDSPTQQFNGSESDNCTSFDKESDWEGDWDSVFEGHHNVDDLCKIATLAKPHYFTHERSDIPSK